MKQIALTPILLSLAAVLAVSPAIARGGHSYGGGRSSFSSPRSSFRFTGSGRESRSIEHVRSYTRRDGDVVSGHDRTRADGTQTDNWSAKGNRNLETGKWGSKPATTDAGMSE